jgi:hypothetical protein
MAAAAASAPAAGAPAAGAGLSARELKELEKRRQKRQQKKEVKKARPRAAAHEGSVAVRVQRAHWLPGLPHAQHAHTPRAARRKP